MASRILVFCGKGGVGKTTVSLWSALQQAMVGQRVLVVTSHPLPELAIAVSLAGLGTRLPGAAKNLFIVHLDAREMLADVVHKNFPVAAADRVVRSAIFRNLVEVAPGLKEFYFLARLQQLAERKTTDSVADQYDMLIWDAPATGHFLSTLRAAKTFEHYLTGPLATAGAEVARFFSNSSNIWVLPVTTLEEMAIVETQEMVQSLASEFGLRIRALVMNLVSPMVAATPDDVAALGTDTDPALRFIYSRGAIERERAEMLRQTMHVQALAIPRFHHLATDLDLAERIAPLLRMAVSE